MLHAVTVHVSTTTIAIHTSTVAEGDAAGHRVGRACGPMRTTSSAAMPEVYATSIGEGDIGCQADSASLAIARSLLKNSPILVLDVGYVRARHRFGATGAGGAGHSHDEPASFVIAHRLSPSPRFPPPAPTRFASITADAESSDTHWSAAGGHLLDALSDASL